MQSIRRLAIIALAVVFVLVGSAIALNRSNPPATQPDARRAERAPRVEERWRVALPVDVVGLPAADQGGVVVTAGGSQVVAISPFGDIEWSVAVDGVLARAPRLDRDLVFVAGERTVIALRRDTGAVEWTVPMAPDGVGNRGNRANRPVVADGIVVVSAADGLVMGLDRATGAQRWRIALPTETTAEPATGTAAGGVDPVVVVVGIGEWRGLDPATGATLWSGDLGLFGTSSPIVYANGVSSLAAVASDEKLIAVNGRTGQLEWHVAAEQSELFQVPVLASNGSELLVPDHWGRLAAFDPHNGRQLWKVTGPDSVAEFGEPVLLDERLVALPLDAGGPRLGSPQGSVALKPPADGHGVADLPSRGLVVTTWGASTSYVVLYGLNRSEAAGTATLDVAVPHPRGR